MKNTKQPEYDPANLIDFQRKNIWMNQVRDSRTEYPKFPFVQVAFGVLLIAGVVTIAKIWGWI